VEGVGVVIVLVTGATGLVGTALTAALLERGDAVVALVRGDGAVDAVDTRCTVARGDVLDEEALARAFATRPVDLVFHLAGQSIVEDALGAPDDAWDVNVRGTEQVLDAARAAGVGRAVVASSIRVYGPPVGDVPPREDARLAADDAYGATTAVADRIARGFWARHGMAVAVVRAGNAYGGGDRHRSRLVPEAIDAALAGRAPVLRSDGSAPLNLLHVDDLVAAHLAVAAALDVEDPARSARGEAFNAGGDDPRPVAEIAALVGRLAGSPLDPVLGEAPDADAPDARIDSTKLRERTGWAPRVALEDGLERAIAEDRARARGESGSG
jgi:CDP-glucose 4,6-dehydratase